MTADHVTAPSRTPEVVADSDEAPLVFDRLDDQGNLIPGRDHKVPTKEVRVEEPRAVKPEKPAAEGTRRLPNLKAPPPPLPVREKEAMRLYQDAYALYEKQHYEESITGFQGFVEKNPTHGYADNAVYWMGEAYYDRGLWTQAAETFREVVQSYPLGNKVPDAMLKLGLCYHNLKNFRQARDVLQQVIDIYPKTDVARIATTRLEQLP